MFRNNGKHGHALLRARMRWWVRAMLVGGSEVHGASVWRTLQAAVYVCLFGTAATGPLSGEETCCVRARMRWWVRAMLVGAEAIDSFVWSCCVSIQWKPRTHTDTYTAPSSSGHSLREIRSEPPFFFLMQMLFMFRVSKMLITPLKSNSSLTLAVKQHFFPCSVTHSYFSFSVVSQVWPMALSEALFFFLCHPNLGENLNKSALRRSRML